MATQKHSNIRVLDDLTNRIRWSEGTLQTVLEDEHLDPPVIDAISSAVHHLTEVRQLVNDLPRVNGPAMAALDLTFDVNGDEWTVLGALGELNDTIPEGDVAKPLLSGINRVLLGKAQAEYGTEAQRAAQRAIERGDDPDTVADIEADTREVLDENSGRAFTRNMLLREGDHIEATALAEQAKMIVRIAIQHAQNADVRESLIALEAADRTIERVEQLIDGAQLDEASDPTTESEQGKGDDEPAVDVEDALRHLSNALRLVTTCAAALDGQYADAKHDVKVTLGQDVETAIYETAAALGCKRDSCGVDFP